MNIDTLINQRIEDALHEHTQRQHKQTVLSNVTGEDQVSMTLISKGVTKINDYIPKNIFQPSSHDVALSGLVFRVFWHITENNDGTKVRIQYQNREYGIVATSHGFPGIRIVDVVNPGALYQIRIDIQGNVVITMDGEDVPEVSSYINYNEIASILKAYLSVVEVDDEDTVEIPSYLWNMLSTAVYDFDLSSMGIHLDPNDTNNIHINLTTKHRTYVAIVTRASINLTVPKVKYTIPRDIGYLYIVPCKELVGMLYCKLKIMQIMLTKDKTDGK